MLKKFSWEGAHFVSAEMESRWLTVVMSRATRALSRQEDREQGKRASPRLIRIANEMGLPLAGGPMPPPANCII